MADDALKHEMFTRLLKDRGVRAACSALSAQLAEAVVQAAQAMGIGEWDEDMAEDMRPMVHDLVTDSLAHVADAAIDHLRGEPIGEAAGVHPGRGLGPEDDDEGQGGRTIGMRSVAAPQKSTQPTQSTGGTTAKMASGKTASVDWGGFEEADDLDEGDEEPAKKRRACPVCKGTGKVDSLKGGPMDKRKSRMQCTLCHGRGTVPAEAGKVDEVYDGNPAMGQAYTGRRGGPSMEDVYGRPERAARKAQLKKRFDYSDAPPYGEDDDDDSLDEAIETLWGVRLEDGPLHSQNEMKLGVAGTPLNFGFDVDDDEDDFKTTAPRGFLGKKAPDTVAMSKVKKRASKKKS